MLDSEISKRLGLDNLGINLELATYQDAANDSDDFVQQSSSVKGHLLIPFVIRNIDSTSCPFWFDSANSSVLGILNMGKAFRKESDFSKFNRLADALNSRKDGRKFDKKVHGDAFPAPVISKDGQLFMAVVGCVAVTERGVSEEGRKFLANGQRLIELAFSDRLLQGKADVDDDESRDITEQAIAVQSKLQKGTRTDAGATYDLSFANSLGEAIETQERLEVPPAPPIPEAYSYVSKIRVLNRPSADMYYPVEIATPINGPEQKGVGFFQCTAEEVLIFDVAYHLEIGFEVLLQVNSSDREGNERGIAKVSKDEFDFFEYAFSFLEHSNRSEYIDEFSFEEMIEKLRSSLDS